MEKTFCELLPKIELHAHLNGSISIETLKELRTINLKNGELQLDDKTWAEWEQIFFQPQISTLSEWFQTFKVAHSVTITPDMVQLATERVIADFARDNVIYLELRSTLRQESKMTKSQYLESMIAGVKHCRSSFPDIIVKLIVSLNRKESIDASRENIDLAIKYSKIEPAIVVGVDLSGDPHEKSFCDFIQLLDKARKENLKLTIHFGEIPSVEEVHSVLRYQPHRLGHGTCVHESLKGNKETWSLLLESKIPVEICITSNVKCKTVPSVDKHHFKYLYLAKHPIALSTDDKCVFQTNLSAEYNIAQSNFSLSSNELWELSYNAVEYSFAEDFEKSQLRDFLVSWKKMFLP